MVYVSWLLVCMRPDRPQYISPTADARIGQFQRGGKCRAIPKGRKMHPTFEILGVCPARVSLLNLVVEWWVSVSENICSGRVGAS